ncbi:hypothetical protein B0H67DRAFT_548203 [Lasiosphaeris hirsuta]|uniref:Uncharacterized protein n=1 Tax=Lasiosphaeris hirsuta TaxID=260670 RepID=A0AA40ECD8_9PEZI|nr:hypothetical protein B0H67DRAFT_548203 [Lasiosphaeris hirsuta]
MHAKNGSTDTPQTVFALLWTLVSWCGYTRHYFSYVGIYATDLLFLAPFTSTAVLLGNPLSSTACAGLSANSNFTISVSPGAIPPSFRTPEALISSSVCHRSDEEAGIGLGLWAYPNPNQDNPTLRGTRRKSPKSTPTGDRRNQQPASTRAGSRVGPSHQKTRNTFGQDKFGETTLPVKTNSGAMSGERPSRFHRGEQTLEVIPEYPLPSPLPSPSPRFWRLFRRSLRNSLPVAEPAPSSTRYEDMPQDQDVSPGYGAANVFGTQIATPLPDIPRNMVGTTDEYHKRERSTETIQIGLAVAPKTESMLTFKSRASEPLEGSAYNQPETIDRVQGDVEMGDVNPKIPPQTTTYLPVVRPTSSCYSSMYETERPSSSDDDSALGPRPAETEEQVCAQDSRSQEISPTQADRHQKPVSVAPEERPPAPVAPARYPPTPPAPQRFATMWPFISPIELPAGKSTFGPVEAIHEPIVPLAPLTMREDGNPSANVRKSRRRSMVQSMHGWWDMMNPWEGSEDKRTEAGAGRRTGRLRHVRKDTV